MKHPFLIFIFCVVFSPFLNAQISPAKFGHLNFKGRALLINPAKSFSLQNYSASKDLSMKYHPAKLPFFCAMEEKSRNRFKITLKFRAGDDESYRKMIRSNHS